MFASDPRSGFLYTLHFLAKQQHLGLSYHYIAKTMICACERSAL